ncbi:MAG TPA: DUF4167 domain-containing protein [Sphingomicrobium sp.]
MINNRQGGRRRGRGGQRGQSLGGQPGGNRQDNRQRGNAAQLLEKYKSMARDAQLAGDRVQSEYYLQFAEHYFRVLSESRARFEEQNPRRQRDDDLDDEDGDEMDVSAEDNSDEEEQPQRRERSERRDRGERPDRQRRYSREDRNRDEGDERNGVERGNGVDERIAMDVLPPAIGREEGANDEGGEEVEEARPRRRARRPRAQDEGDIAPAA